MGNLERIVDELNQRVEPVSEEERTKRIGRTAKAIKAEIFEVEEELLEGVQCHCCGRFVLQAYHLWSLENNFCVCIDDMEKVKALL